MPNAGEQGDGQQPQKVGFFCKCAPDPGAKMQPETLLPKHASVPVFFLYGEPRREVGPRFLHLEPLEDRSKASGWNIRPHAHTDLHHVFFVTCGHGQLSADGDSIPFKAPCLLLVPAGTVHGFTYEPGARGRVLTIADAYLRDLIRREPDFSAVFSSVRCLRLDDDAALEELLSRLGQELVWNAPGYAAAIEGHLLALLVTLLRLSRYTAQELKHVAGRAAGWVARFREQIEAKYRSGAPLQEYLQALRITHAQLRRACLQVTQQPPALLIQDRIFLEAQRVLLYTNTTVAEAASYLGFRDSAYFTRFFTKRAGVSPREFRRQACENQR
jgi:AraC family transcriptional regulator, transcriptional activator of pobA